MLLGPRRPDKAFAEATARLGVSLEAALAGDGTAGPSDEAGLATGAFNRLNFAVGLARDALGGTAAPAQAPAAMGGRIGVG